MAQDTSEIRFEQPRSTFGTWLAIVMLFCVFALFVWAVMGAMTRKDSYEQRRAQARLEKMKAAQDEAKTAMQGYGWVDKTKGVVRLPIDRAMDMTVTELAQKKPAPGPAIPPDAAQAGLQTTAPAAPSPVATQPAAAKAMPTPHTAITGKDSETKGAAAASANPPAAQPGTQPGPNATPAASPPAPADQPGLGAGQPTPVQQPPGTPIPVPGTTPR